MTTASVRLSSLTTIGLGGPAPQVHTARSVAEVAELLGRPGGTSSGWRGQRREPGGPRRAPDSGSGVAGAGPGGRSSAPGDVDGEPAPLVIGGGSNLVIADAGIDVPVLRIAIAGLELAAEPSGGGTLATIGAGEDWDTVVAALVEAGFAGVETLSGIPGLAGATPIQNVGAYGADIAGVLESVQAYHRRSGEVRVFTPADLALGYRTSVLRGTATAVVTAVTLRLSKAPRPVRYAELAAALGVPPGAAVPPADVRHAVLALRRRKGMLLDPDDPDTRSVGSFFTNPILSDADLAVTTSAIEAVLGAGTAFPRYPAAGGTKLSAAWLIERAGFTRGYPGADARIAISGKHALALTNRGGGSTAELIELAAQIRDRVRERFHVTLRPEPVLVGVSL